MYVTHHVGASTDQAQAAVAEESVRIVGVFKRDGRATNCVNAEAVAASLKLHLARVKALHNQDLAEGFGDVYLPFALEKKYPNADKEWGWQYIFPSINISVDPRSGKTRRHHLDEKGVQRAMKQAVATTHIAKPATPHTLPFVRDAFIAERL